MQRLQSWLIASLLAGCLVLGYFALQQKIEIAREELDLGSADGASQKRIVELQHQLAAAQAVQAQGEKQLAKLKQSSGPVSAEGVRRVIHISDMVRDHPEYAAIAARDQRRDMLRQYGVGLAGLNLPPDQLAKLKDLLVERTASANDAQQAAEAAGLERGSPAWREALKQASDAMDQEITTALGTDSGPVLQKLQQSSSAHSQIQYNYAPDFVDGNVPLSAEQSQGFEQVVAGYYAGQPNVPAARQADYYQADPTTGLSPNDNRLLEAAAQVLSPEQLQILKADQIRQNQQSAIIRQYIPKNFRGGISITTP